MGKPISESGRKNGPVKSGRAAGLQGGLWS